MELYNNSINIKIASQVIIANKYFSRMKGLLGRDGLSYDKCMVIYPCNSVHTYFMKFPIDVLFLNKEYKVVRIIENLRPFKVSPFVRKAYYVVEIAARPGIKNMIHEGDQLEIRS